MAIRFCTSLLISTLVSQFFLVQTLMGQESLQSQFAEVIDRAGKSKFSGIVVAEKDGKVIANQNLPRQQNRWV